MNKCLIIGASGIIAKSILSIKQNDLSFVLSQHLHPSEPNYLDLANPRSIETCIENVKPEAILNCGGLNDVRACEKDKISATSLNLRGTKVLSKICKTNKIYFINFSSSHIYGNTQGFANEYTEANPLSHYSKLKAEADKFIKENNDFYLTLRPNTVIGYLPNLNRKNILVHLLESFHNKQKIRLAKDTKINFVPNIDIAKATLFLMKGFHTGEFNIGGSESLSHMDLGNSLAKHLDKKNIFESVPHITFKDSALSPKNSQLDSSKIKQLGFAEFTKIDSCISDALKSYCMQMSNK